LREQSARLKALSAQLDKEKVDVEKLERTGLTAMFQAALGSREQQLEKERQDLLSTQLLYRQTSHQVEVLKQEKESLRAQLEGMQDVDADYELLLADYERFLQASKQVTAHQFTEYSQQAAYLGAEVKEISEAITAGNDVIADLDQLIRSLVCAESWGIWDTLGGGLVSTAIKHSSIEDARSSIDNIQAKMSRFIRELADVRKDVELKIDIGEFESFADFFFDGLIADWIVQSRIVESLERSKKARVVVAQAVMELEGQKKSAQRKEADIRERQAQFLESA
jgi:SepF-like predicted cell division protein (DUF552 family)